MTKKSIIAVLVITAFFFIHSANATVFHNNMVLRIPFDEGTGITAIDTSSNGSSATLMNGATWDTGFISSYALSLNGVDQYAYVPSAPYLQGFSHGFTVCGFGYLNAYNAIDASVLVAKETSPIGQNSNDPWTLWELYVRKTGNIGFALSDGITGHAQYFDSDVNFPVGQWTQVCGVYNGDTMSIITNGTVRATKTIGPVTIGSNDIPVIIGAFGAGDIFDGWNGRIDDVRIYDRPLNIAEMNGLYKPTFPQVYLNGPEHATTSLGTPYIDPGAYASDFTDGSLDVSVVTEPNPVDFNVPSTYIIRYFATNSQSITASTSRTVDIEAGSIVDLPPPTDGDSENGAVSNATDMLPPPTDGDDQNGAVAGPIVTAGIVTVESLSTTTTETATSTDVSSTTPDKPAPTEHSLVTTTASNAGVNINIGGGSHGPLNPTPNILTVNAPVHTDAPKCEAYMSSTLHYSKDNDSEEVTKLQALLNEVLGSDLPLNGRFDRETLEALKEFQLKYKDTILQPWISHGLNHNGKPTGVVGPTTLWTINHLVCPSLNQPMPEVR